MYFGHHGKDLVYQKQVRNNQFIMVAGLGEADTIPKRVIKFQMIKIQTYDGN